MQADTITLAVDVLNNGTPSNEAFTRYEEYQNRSTYIGTGHVPDSRNMFGIYRTFPTKNGNFKGTAKSSVKFTDDVEVTGVDGISSITAPVILEASFSVPVGTTAADLKHFRQRLIALLDNDSFMDSLSIQLMV